MGKRAQNPTLKAIKARESATLGAWDKKKKELTQLKNKMEEIGGGKTNETMEQNPSDLGKLKQ